MIGKKIGVIFVVLSLFAVAQSLSRVSHKHTRNEQNSEADVVLAGAEDDKDLKGTHHCEGIDCDKEEKLARKESSKEISGESSEDHVDDLALQKAHEINDVRIVDVDTIEISLDDDDDTDFVEDPESYHDIF